MSRPNIFQSLTVENVNVRIFDSKKDLGIEAAKQAASVIRQALSSRNWARIIVATGNSQIELIEALTVEPINWSRVEVFHMDEYLGISENHPASFRRWIKERLADRVHPARVHYIDGDAADIEEEMQRYASLLVAEPIDLTLLGIGENGHIAFNDPPTDFQDARTIKRVTLDEVSRLQQLNEGHFPNIEVVPKEAITLTCPALLRGATWICCAPDQRKAKVVQCALEGPVSPDCPASLVRVHPDTFVYLDRESASLLHHG